MSSPPLPGSSTVNRSVSLELAGFPEPSPDSRAQPQSAVDVLLTVSMVCGVIGQCFTGGEWEG